MKINKRILSIIMSIFLTFTLINTNTVFAFATNDLIPDTNLRASILEALNQSSDYKITKEDLSKISVLNADNYDISSLKGLEYCTNLSFLSLSNNKINDLSPLKNLTQLTQLSLKNNNITNIAPLSGLVNLSILSLSNNNISDISYVKNLSNISYLNIYGNKVKDITWLKGLKTLENLNANSNSIVDLSPLNSLTKLKSLDVSRQNIVLDEEHFSNNIILDNILVNVDGSPVTNILNISNNGTYKTDTNQLSFNLETDKTISFEFNQKVSIGTATSTFSGNVSKNIIIDSQAVAISDSNLKSILLNKLGKDENYEIKAKDLSTITELNADDKSITSLSGLEYCTNLTSLSLKSNNISDIKELSKLDKLTFLNLSNNSISDISPIANLTKLTTLSITNNNISDVHYLTNCKSLNYLNLACNKICDLSQLSTLTNLNSINLSEQKIILPVEKVTKDLVITNPLVNFDNTPIKTITDINYSGYFDSNNNTINWPNITKSANYSFNFKESITLGKINATFSGNVSKAITFDFTAVNITDSALKEYLLNLFKKSSSDYISTNDLANLTSLNLDNKNITNIEPLKYCSNLKTLSISNNNIENLTPLSSLTNLTNLTFKNNKVSDLSALENLTNLTFVNGANNKIQDITVLSKLTKLNMLSLQNNTINNVKALKELTSLTYLNLYSNGIYDISPLKNLNKITTLNVAEQNVILPDEVATKKVTVKNPIIALDGANSVSINNVNNYGKYNTTDNSIEWSNITKSGLYTFNFTSPVILGTVSTNFNGRVIKNVTFNGNIVTLKNEAIKDAAYTALVKNSTDSITDNELATISNLNLDNKNITSIEDLKYFTGLSTLSLSSNNIEDISPLANLINLTNLTLKDNKISDLTPLKNLTNLTSLNLYGNNISNIDSLSNLKKLSILSLSNNNVESLVALSSLTNLTYINLYNNAVSNLTPLNNLTKLTSLNLSEQDIVLPSEISTKDVLIKNPLINVDSTPIKNITNINNSGIFDSSENTAKWLNIRTSGKYAFNFETKISVSSLEVTFSGRVSKDINYNYNEVKIEDNTLKNAFLTALNKTSDDILTSNDLASLTKLNLDNLNISSLKGLEYCTGLVELSASNNNISDLSPLKNLSKLNILTLKNNNISDLSDLSNLTKLTFLNLSNNNINDVTSLENLSKLTTLSLSNNKIKDASPLASLINLTYLNLYKNCIYNVSSLKSLTKLSTLNLSEQSIVLDSENTYRTFKLVNPLVNIDNKAITNITSITYPGKFDADNNSIEWTDIKADTELSFNFCESQNIGAAIANFNGKVSKKVIFVDTIISIPDENLKSALLEALSKPSTYNYY
ncbi:leucine-rich repeat domain-containing protein [uncultured Clostridium sp.]|uniref:leucine-rich repeat domain-containing protein n=1 Tax=uncultured Clostridium sp. TaxID=59620 RepID=UPI002600EFCF|nr:leucine-rich repeat domain-containing protein [uncultured Clostridium sp.]